MKECVMVMKEIMNVRAKRMTITTEHVNSFNYSGCNKIAENRDLEKIIRFN
jgi:hypothetical protein